MWTVDGAPRPLSAKACCILCSDQLLLLQQTVVVGEGAQGVELNYEGGAGMLRMEAGFGLPERLLSNAPFAVPSTN